MLRGEGGDPVLVRIERYTHVGLECKGGGRAEEAERAERAEKAERTERTEKAERAEKADRVERVSERVLYQALLSHAETAHHVVAEVCKGLQKQHAGLRVWVMRQSYVAVVDGGAH